MARFASLVPNLRGDKLNNTHLSIAGAIYVASRVPGGGVIFPTSSESFDVYSEQRVRRYQELLKQVKKEHSNVG